MIEYRLKNIRRITAACYNNHTLSLSKELLTISTIAARIALGSARVKQRMISASHLHKKGRA
ncbi:MAG: hypothetical protein H8D56_02485 [Planctomycetes bacterium]|nr:hypothetical protein [Planctomycetota bacterium]